MGNNSNSFTHGLLIASDIISGYEVPTEKFNVPGWRSAIMRYYFRFEPPEWEWEPPFWT